MDAVLEKQLKQAKAASRIMMRMDTASKNAALINISEVLTERMNEILEANQQDLQVAVVHQMSEAMQDRLMLNEERILKMASDVLKLVELDDPIGQSIREINRPNGLKLNQVRVPIGVFGIIYEARPNVTVDIASLCMKSGNVCVLKGGKEAFHTNLILTKLMKDAIRDILPEDVVCFVEKQEREVVEMLIHANQYVDVVIPRGGKGLIDYVVQNASVPVIETGAGNCHLYIDEDADMTKAINISVNAKMQRPSVCNAIETILVHDAIAETYLPQLANAYAGVVEIRGDDLTRKIIRCEEATEADYATEYDDYIVAIKIVTSLDEAIDHIYQYSTKHSESIITENPQHADQFMMALDSACVYHNASTRFSDGGEFGFGAELGISTQKLHARGPMALQEMTSYQYRIHGDGQIRE